MATAAERMLGDLVDRLYGPGTGEPHDWGATVAALGRYVGGAHGQFLAGRVSTGHVAVAAFSGAEPRCVRAYLAEHSAGRARPGAVAAYAGHIASGHTLDPSETCLQRFRRLDPPSGHGRQLTMARSPDGDEMAIVGVLRPDWARPFGPAAAARFGIAARQVLRAYDLHKTVVRHTASAASLRAGFEAALRPTALVNAAGRALLLNQGAEDLVRRGVLVRATGGRLSVGDAAAAKRFDTLLAAAAGSASSPARAPGPPAAPGDVVVLQQLDSSAPSGLRRFAARAFPVAAAHPFRLVAEAAAAAVLVADLDGAPGGAAEPDPSALASAFQLTGKEARLAAFVGAGLSLETAEAEFGVSRNTLRTQLQAVFDKTGAKRQAELVRLVQAIAALRL